MEFSIKSDTVKLLRVVHCIYLGVTSYNLQKIDFFSDEMPHHSPFVIVPVKECPVRNGLMINNSL